MDEWRDLIFQTLERLGARERLLPGSLVMQQIVRSAPEQGEDLRAHLRETKTSFSKFLAQYPEIQLILRGQADMLVGFEGAQEGPVPAPPIEFRSDVYNAFSKRVDRPYFYDRTQKRFKQDPTDADDVVPVPLISHEFLVEERKEFADKQTPEAANELNEALRGDRPLTAFRNCINRLQLHQQWARFRLNSVDERLQEWARDSGIPVAKEWYNQNSFRSTFNARGAIDIILNEMTDDEIRTLNVPIRAVEQVLQKLLTTRSDR